MTRKSGFEEASYIGAVGKTEEAANEKKAALEDCGTKLLGF